MGRSRYHFLNTQPHFLTCTVVNWLTLFSNPKLAQILLNSLDFLQQQQRLTVHGYVIMENHLHLIASADDLSREVANFKSFTARSMIDWLQQERSVYWLEQLKIQKLAHKTGQTYQVWQEGSHPHAIANEAMLIQKLEYIHTIPFVAAISTIQPTGVTPAIEITPEPQAYWRSQNSNLPLSRPGSPALRGNPALRFRLLSTAWLRQSLAGEFPAGDWEPETRFFSPEFPRGAGEPCVEAPPAEHSMVEAEPRWGVPSRRLGTRGNQRNRTKPAVWG
jgi:putative transposase